MTFYIKSAFLYFLIIHSVVFFYSFAIFRLHWKKRIVKSSTRTNIFWTDHFGASLFRPIDPRNSNGKERAVRKASFFFPNFSFPHRPASNIPKKCPHCRLCADDPAAIAQIYPRIKSCTNVERERERAPENLSRDSYRRELPESRKLRCVRATRYPAVALAGQILGVLVSSDVLNSLAIYLGTEKRNDKLKKVTIVSLPTTFSGRN